jgi:prepilin-type N-terminal cleavage/methylation domain-containing protein
MKILADQKAFTIVELIVVVAIIAILTAITTANFTTSKAKSRDTKRASDILQMQLALELFFDRCNQYPTATAYVAAPLANAMPDIAAANGCPAGITLGSFIGKIPTPSTANDYAYSVNNASTPTDYILRAKMETTSSALNDDIDTTSSTVNLPNPPGALACDDASLYYCVQPK